MRSMVITLLRYNVFIVRITTCPIGYILKKVSDHFVQENTGFLVSLNSGSNWEKTKMPPLIII